MRTTFAVGRVSPKNSEIVWVDDQEAPSPGPWKLKAITRRPPPVQRHHMERGLKLVH